MNTTKSGDLAEKLVKIKRQRNELLQAAELIITENILIINAGEESNGVARLDKVVIIIKVEIVSRAIKAKYMTILMMKTYRFKEANYEI